MTEENTINVRCGKLTVDIPISELRAAAGAPGILVHPTATRGPLGVAIVVVADTHEVLDPDDDGAFFVFGKRRMLAEILWAPKKRKPRRANK